MSLPSNTLFSTALPSPALGSAGRMQQAPLPVVSSSLPLGSTALPTMRQGLVVPPLQSIPDAYFLLRNQEPEESALPKLSLWQNLQLTWILNKSKWQTGAPFKPWFGKLQLSEERADVGLLPVTPQLGLLYKANGQQVGSVNAQGELKLTQRPGVWDVYNNPFLQLDYQQLKQQGPLGQALLGLAFNHALKNNVTPWLRQAAPGLQGQGQHLAVIDFDTNHVKNIHSIIASPTFGLAPKAQLQFHLFEKTPSAFQNMEPNKPPQTLEQLNEMVLSDFLSDFYHIQTQLQQLTESPKPPSVVVMSLTMERLLEYSSLVYEALPRLLPVLLNAQQEGLPLDPPLNHLLDALTAPDLLSSFQAVINYVDSVLDASPELDIAISNYQQLVKQAWEKGSLVVVSAGNSQSHFAKRLTLRSDALLNFLGNSPYVILVGASDARQTPLDTRDDKVAAFSNIGHDPYSHSGAPTLLAPGLLLPIDTNPSSNMEEERAFNNGTSLSAPWVASVLCLMRQANPALTPAQLKTLLLQACENTAGLAPEFVGAGFLNPLKAIQLAVASTSL